MAKQKINIVFKATDLVTRVTKKVSRSIQRLGRNALKSATSLKNWMRIGRQAMAGLAIAGAALAYALKKSFSFESSIIRFKVLLGTMSEAKKRFAEIKEFSAVTPFQIQPIVEASRHLTIFTEKALGGVKSLRMVGDAAAAVGQPIERVAFWVGRAYSLLAGGKKIGRAALSLQRMGVLTAQGRQEMEAMQKAGMNADAVFGRLRQDLMRLSGGMELLAQTGDGLWSTMKDNWIITAATFGDALREMAKNDMRELIKWMRKIRSDGSLQAWAEKTKNALIIVRNLVKDIFAGGERRQDAISGLSAGIKLAFSSAATMAVDILLAGAPTIGKEMGRAFFGILGAGPSEIGKATAAFDKANLTRNEAAATTATVLTFGLASLIPSVGRNAKSAFDKMAQEWGKNEKIESDKRTQEWNDAVGRAIGGASKFVAPAPTQNTNTVTQKFESEVKALADRIGTVAERAKKGQTPFWQTKEAQSLNQKYFWDSRIAKAQDAGDPQQEAAYRVRKMQASMWMNFKKNAGAGKLFYNPLRMAKQQGAGVAERALSSSTSMMNIGEILTMMQTGVKAGAAELGSQTNPMYVTETNPVGAE